MISNSTWLTVEEAAAELGVSVGRIRQMLNAHEKAKENPEKQSHEATLVGKKFGKSWAISRSELNKAKKIERKPGNPNFVAKTG